jgi:formylglycine-generating enzyme required for sulfatase activity/tRNA A-37 threonylcarbamoyl transferase component Bud32
MAKPKPNLSWVGHTLGGRYKIDEFIDQGGMSAVYKATDPNLQRTVAIKIIHAHLSNDPDFVRRFEQEAAAVAQLRHSNIIQVYDFNHDDKTYYMVMEYVPGQTLKDELKRLSDSNQRMPLNNIIQIMAETCEAVAYAHEHNMIHRDLKPANVMLTPQGRAILMDFGVAKMLGGTDQTATGTIIGTAKYMSPEQARGERPDERSDIYALGIMLYEMVAGHPPFDADTTVAILMKHVNEPVPDIRQLHQDVPDELVEIIERALAKKPQERYQSAGYMAAALKLIIRLGQASTPVADAQRTVSSKKRHSTEPSAAPKPSPVPTTSAPPTVKLQPGPTSSSIKTPWIIGAAVVAFVLIAALIGLLFVLLNPFSTDDGGLAGADPNLPSSEGMVRIAAGIYTVGLDASDRDHAPKQNAELSEFWIDQREISNAQYAEFLAATDNQPPTAWAGGAIPADEEGHPVKGVTWELASAYCQWAKKRLPAEAEWEVAARGPEGRLYPWGDKQQAVELPRSGTYKVGGKATNQSPFGVFDMAGNVWEWVGEPYYAPIPAGQRVLRGGANDFLKDMAYRLAGDPNIPTMYASAGFRCAADKVNVVQTETLAENIYYQDNFVDPGSGWPIQSEGVFFYGYHPPDFFHIEVGTANSHTSVSRQPGFDDATVEAEILVNHTTTESGDFRYGVVLRRMSDDEFYAFTVSPRSQSWFILKSSPAGLAVLDQGAANTLQGIAPPGFVPEKTDMLRVDAQGSDFIFHINGQPVAQLSDSDYANGEIGFYVETFDETLAHVHFDSLTIRQVEMGPVEIASNALFEDEFTNPNSGWPTEDVEGSPYRVGYHPPDFYHVEPRAANERTIVSLDKTYTDFTVEADAFVDHTDTETGEYRYGLALRRASDNEFYAFTVSPRSGSWQILKSDANGIDILAEGRVNTLQGFAPAGFTPDKSDKLRVDADGSDFTFHINGQVVAQISDADYASGEVGFYVENFDESLTHVHFETFSIRPVQAALAQVNRPLFEDEFTDPNSGWPTEDVEGSPYRVGYHPPDFYHVEPRAANERIAVSLEQSYEDVTVETDAFIDHTDTENGEYRYGLALRRVSEDEFYAFTISPRSGTWQVLKSSPSGLEVLKEGEVGALQGFAPAGFTPDKSDNLRVDANGPDFTFHINGQQVTKVNDSSYASGGVGFFAENFDETLTHAHFESFIVRPVEAAPVQAVKILYEDKFTDPNSGWLTEDVEGSPYRVGYHPPDFYHVEPRAANQNVAVSLEQSYEDVTVETEAFVDHTDTETGDYRYGLILRRASENEFYAFTVSPRSALWQVLKSSGSGLEVLAEGEINTLQGFAPAGFTPDKTDKLRVDASGSTFAFHINDEPVIQVSDADYAGGEVGFYVETFDETLAHIHYESLNIKTVDIESLELAPAPTPTLEPATPTPEPTAEPTAEPTEEVAVIVEPPEGMILIPAGHFLMGSTTGQAIERPEHPVFLDAFYLDQYEVTNTQYRECVEARGCTPGGANSVTRQGYRDDPLYDDYPVVNISWDQANAYCQWAGKHLPSEAQWEYAAGGPDNLSWPWDDKFDVTLLPATETDTQPVGSYAQGASTFGIHDMAGNVSEWVADDFDENFYTDSPPLNPLSADVSGGRLYRGGSFGNRNGVFYTTSRRYGNVRTYSDPGLGFRCALNAAEVTPSEERAELVAAFCEIYADYKPGAPCP